MDHTDDLAGEIVAAAREGLGGRLRSVVHVAPASAELLYTREGVEAPDPAARGAALALVESGGRSADTGLGAHRYTVRVHDDGLAVGIAGGGGAVVLTLEGTDTGGLEPTVRSLRRLLGRRSYVVSGGSLVPL